EASLPANIIARRDHVLRELMNAADDAGVCNHVPKAVVTDGSPANHKALIEKAKEKKAAAKLPESVWRAILNDLRLLADATTRDEWRVLRDLCLGEWLQDTHAENVAIKCFFDKFSHYLNDEDWRSYWGSYAIGPRTNNGVERFNGELKKVLLKSRYRRTLSELGSFFASPRKWIRLSQYGGRQLFGEVTKKQRKLAARLFQREIYCLIPATWHPTSSEHYQGDQWLYARDESQGGSSGGQLSDHVFGEEDFEANKMVNYSYASLAEVRRLRKTYFIVSYKRTADPHAPPPDGPTCSCIQWSRKHIYSHVICTAYLMQEEVSEEWKMGASQTKPCLKISATGSNEGLEDHPSDLGRSSEIQADPQQAHAIKPAEPERLSGQICKWCDTIDTVGALTWKLCMLSQITKDQPQNLLRDFLVARYYPTAVKKRDAR
ncbi:hypothetical protein FOZ63_004673, partial [Perkinsus olseni]